MTISAVPSSSYSIPEKFLKAGIQFKQWQGRFIKQLNHLLENHSKKTLGALAIATFAAGYIQTACVISLIGIGFFLYKHYQRKCSPLLMIQTATTSTAIKIPDTAPHLVKTSENKNSKLSIRTQATKRDRFKNQLSPLTSPPRKRFVLESEWENPVTKALPELAISSVQLLLPDGLTIEKLISIQILNYLGVQFLKKYVPVSHTHFLKKYGGIALESLAFYHSSASTNSQIIAATAYTAYIIFQERNRLYKLFSRMKPSKTFA